MKSGVGARLGIDQPFDCSSHGDTWFARYTPHAISAVQPSASGSDGSSACLHHRLVKTEAREGPQGKPAAVRPC